jgi:hypothetical protein
VTDVKKLPVIRTLSALLAVTALAALWGVVVPASAASPTDNRPTDERFVATELPNSPAGRQLRWLIDASARLPLSEAELRAHFAKEFLAMPGGSPAETNQGLALLSGERGMQLRGLVAVAPKALVAVVAGAGSRELGVTLAVNHAGLSPSSRRLQALPRSRCPRPPGATWSERTSFRWSTAPAVGGA